ncbi:MAG TPA: sigma-70 family RNA polymerase sigma factor [Anaerolineales bacterium]|nr:sigma-70 family RNA polymerase sigma factor [Anaerolineales bacterium]
MDLPGEKTFVAQARKDPQAFAALYDLYVDRIYAYAYRRSGDVALAQDITSATFEKALRHIRRYKWQKKSFVAWLYTIARNESVRLYRETARTTLTAVQPVAQQDVEQTVDQRQRESRLRLALADLSEADREIITLRYFEDLSSAEVAEVLNISVNNVYVRLHRALERLRQIYEGSDTTAEANSASDRLGEAHNVSG